MSGSVIIRELINVLGFEVDDASFQAAAQAVDVIEAAMAAIAPVADAAAVAVSGLVAQLQAAGPEAQALAAFSTVLNEWTQGTGEATARLGLMRDEAAAAEIAARRRHEEALAAEAAAKVAGAAAQAAAVEQREAAAAAEEQVKKAQEVKKAAAEAAREEKRAAAAAKEAAEASKGGWRQVLSVLADVNQALQLVGQVATSVVAPVAELVEHAKGVNLSADMLGVDAGLLQEWQYGIAAVGGEADELGEALLDLTDKMVAAKKGEGEQAELFAALKVKVKDSKGELMNLEEFLPVLADAFADVENSSERAGMASQLLGETGAKTLLPFFNRGSAGMAALGAEARRMGAVLSGPTLAAARAWGEETGRLGAAFEALKYELGGEMILALRTVVSTLRDFIADNRELLSMGIDKAMLVLTGAARVLVQVGGPLVKLFSALVGHSWLLNAALTAAAVAALYYGGAALMAAAGSTWGLIPAFLSAASSAWAMVPSLGAAAKSLSTTLFLMRMAGLEGWKLAASQWAASISAAAAPWLIPIAWGLVFALLVGMVEDVYTFFMGGDSVIGDWGKWIGEVLRIDGTDSQLVRFLKWLGLLIFDTAGAFEMAGKSITEAWDWVADKVGNAVRRMTDFILSFLDLAVGPRVRGVLDWLDGGKTTGVLGDFAPAARLGSGASGASALASSVSSSSSTQSSVYAPRLQLNQEINVGANASPAEIARAGVSGTTQAWDELLQDASFTAGNGA